MESNENENKTYHNLWDTAKAELKGKFISWVPSLKIKDFKSKPVDEKIIKIKISAEK
jgi:hypothetical protein